MSTSSSKIFDGLNDALRWTYGNASGWVNLPGSGRRKMTRLEYEAWLRDRDNAISATPSSSARA